MVEQAAENIQPRRICYVDDSRTSAFVTRKMLEKRGYVVEHFVAAEDALEAFMERDYDLLITDLMITTEGDGVNGDDLIRLVRFSGHPSKAGIPIIVVTGTADEGVTQQLLDTGANHVLLKPLDEQALDDIISSALDVPETVSQQNISSSTLKDAPEIMSPEPVAITEQLSEEIDNEPLVQEDKGQTLTLKDQLSSHIEKQEEAFIPTLTEEVGSSREVFASEQKKEKASPADFEKRAITPINSVVDIPLVDALDAGRSDAEDNEPVVHGSADQESLNVNAQVPVRDTVSMKDPELSLKPLDEQSEDLYKPKAQPEKSQRPDGSQFGIDLDAMFPSDSERKDDKPTAKESTGVVEGPDEFDVDSFFLSNESVEEKNDEVIEQRPVEIDQDARIFDDVDSSVDQIAEPEWLKTSRSKREDKEVNPLLSLLDQFDEDQSESVSSNSVISKKFSKPSLNWKINLSPEARKVALGVLAFVLIVPPLVYAIFQETLLEVDIAVVEMAPIHDAVSVSGQVVSKKQVEVTSFFPGQISKVKVKEGQQVKKGDVLAILDGREARSRVTRAEAKLLSIQEKVSLSRKSLQRLQRALDQGAVSRQMVEDAEAKWKTESAKQSLSEEELKEARLLVERLSIRAPFTGLVSTLVSQEGQWLAPPEPLLKLVDMSNIEVELRVDAADSANLLAGQTVELSSDAFPGQSWEEKIIRIASTTQRENSNNFISVFVTLGDKAPSLKVGQQIDASVRIASNNRALVVPFEALKQINGQTMVAVNLNGRVHYVPVVTGIESFSRVEVTKGLTVGQEVLLPGGLNLEEGQKISNVEQ